MFKFRKKNNSADKQARAKELFEDTPVRKAAWIVAVPGLLTSLMIGLYAFLNQVFILNFVPKTVSLLYGDLATDPNSGQLYDYLSSWNGVKLSRDEFNLISNVYSSYLTTGENISKITGDSIATISVNATIPFTIFSSSIIFLIPVGASVYYTKCISKNLERTGKDLWSTSFYTTIFVSIITALLMYVGIWSGLLNLLISNSNLNVDALEKLNNNQDVKMLLAKHGYINEASEVLKDYFKAGENMSLYWAKLYIYIYGAGTLIQGVYVLISYLIRSEGKNSYVMFWAIIANLVGIGFNALFIMVFKMGVLGGVLATIIGWSVNLLSYIAYIVYNNKRQSTWISVHHLVSFKFRLKFLSPISLLGFSAFLRSFGVSIASFLITYLLGHMPFSEGAISIYNWSKAAPVVTLFFIALFGIADGIRSLLSYNYSKRNFKKCNEIFKWAMIITFTYAFVVVLLGVALAPQFLWMLNTRTATGGVLAQNSGPVIYLRINIWRMLFYSFAIGGILLFQGTNNIKMSIIVTAMEGFITFWFVMGSCVGLGFILHNAGASLFVSSLMISIGYVLNALIAGIIIFILSLWYLKKTLPNIDNIKQSWSRKIEHEFFEKAEIEEKIYFDNFKTSKI
ncbi:MATE family efflux transporter [Mycoplasma crocodyli]|uniref:Sodium-dependent multidrug efflux protein n=1 Tax=Mycoplasma crocodyli (strain ATCC 51981 / MP145) TaxID=512564 RepID=D5E4K1_MYCCM|nr:MATE family efflux transporter [Mycoplasma crocodyli]ADE19944.1 sodium-dependent multidrug efflux protein [Mycoplasma crocodyli MP145]